MSSPTIQFAVQRGQVFVPCVHYNSDPMQTFIVQEVTGAQAYVIAPWAGRRLHGKHMWVSLKSLNETDTTPQGQPRTRGYRLFSGPPTDTERLCGHCLQYVDREVIAEDSGGPVGGLCRQCKTAIDKEWT